MRRPAALAALALILGLALGAAVSDDPNPPAPGFDLEGSDARALEIADRVMQKIGGRRAWDETRYLRWRFFGRRLHVWDKATGNIRVEGVGRDDGEPYLILMNLRSGEGRAWRSGREVTEPEALAELLELGEAAWINDSYWLFMPYKLKDTGVTLGYLGERAMEDSRTAEVLELTFREVGRTPENKYHVYVAKDSGLVEQWDYYAEAGDAEPRFKFPWHNWQPYGRILLSEDRGEGAHTEVAVFDELPETVFTSPTPIDWSRLTP